MCSADSKLKPPMNGPQPACLVTNEKLTIDKIHFCGGELLIYSNANAISELLYNQTVNIWEYAEN